jgi:hypothetical protein
MKRYFILENEKKDISSQHEEIDRTLMNFLVRRIKIRERELGGHWEEPFKVIEYTFEDLPGYGFSNYHTKKDIEKKIIDMLYENDKIGEEVYDIKNELDVNRQKIVKTIRKFLNFILKK